MPPPDETREEALARLKQTAGALEARTARTQHDEHGAAAASYGYRLMGTLIGGVLVGLGLGAAIDVVAKSAPWGMIVGVLVGFGISIWLTVRSARLMSQEVAKEWGPPKDLPEDDGDD